VHAVFVLVQRRNENHRDHRQRRDIHERVVTGRGEPSAESVSGLVFGSVADRYERYRLGYPGELFAAVLRYAGRPIRVALEVGAGTGKAARLFASRGVEVTALEPDAEMAELLAETTQRLPVKPVVVTFERFHTERRFDLVYAAAAWHWTNPRTRWAKVVELLVPGGVLALFGRPGELKDPALFAAVDDIERRLLPEKTRTAGHPWSIDDMASVDGLTDVAEQRLTGVETTTTDDFLARLATVSAYLRLEPEHRAEILRQVRAVLPAQVDIDTTVQLALGRRV
jgi:SAM-dependent methyltransferase